MKIHHIGILTKEISKAIFLYSKLGYVLDENIKIDNIQNNRIAFLHCDFSPSIELIEPIDENSSVYNFKRGYHHICYEAEPGEDIIQKFKSMRIGKIFTKPIAAPALCNREVVFACLQNGIFIEFIM